MKLMDDETNMGKSCSSVTNLIIPTPTNSDANQNRVDLFAAESGPSKRVDSIYFLI